MAADWIKMRIDLQTHPKIVRILSATKSDKFRAIGGLHAVWSVFDTHSVDGVLEGYTAETLDHIIGWPGFAQAMIDVEWLASPDGKSLVMPEFSEHNGQSAKRRAEDQKRKKNSRNSVRNSSAENEDKKRTREREEKNNKPLTPLQGFDEFWLAYPKKVGKGAAEKAWAKYSPPVAEVLVAVAAQSKSDQWRKDSGQFIPNPATWINQERWKDEQGVSAPANGDDFMRRMLGVSS